MSDRRYTVTEGQLRELFDYAFRIGMNGGSLRLDARFTECLSTLTPDPVENGGEVVELLDYALHNGTGLYNHIGSSGILAIAKHLEPFVTAEVTRQVEERTKVLTEALKFWRESAYSLREHSRHDIYCNSYSQEWNGGIRGECNCGLNDTLEAIANKKDR